MLDINYDLLNSNNTIVVTALDYESPLDNINNVTSLLKKGNMISDSVLVIFDLLSCNGNEWNRFVSMSFDGERFIKSTFKVLSDKKSMSSLVDNQTLFFKQHPEILELSVLN